MAARASGIDISRRSLVPSWASFSWSFFSSTMLPASGGSVTAPLVWALIRSAKLPTIGVRLIETTPPSVLT